MKKYHKYKLWVIWGIVILLYLLFSILGRKRKRSSLNFSGTDDYVVIKDTPSLNITGNITLEAWVKLNDVHLSTILQLGGYNNTAVISILGTEYASYGVQNCAHFGIVEASSNTQYDVFSPNNSIDIDKWYHIIGMRKEDSIYVFLNSVGYSASGFTGDSRHDGNSYIGYDGDTTGANPEWLDGFIDEVRIYSRVLDTIEIVWNYQHPFYPYSTDSLQIWFDFNESAGDTCYDKSGHNNNGILVNSPIWSVESPVILRKAK